MTDAALGSVSHILRTAFKDLYVDAPRAVPTGEGDQEAEIDISEQQLSPEHQQLDEELRTKQKQANELLSQLRDARSRRVVAKQREEDELKRQGIFNGAGLLLDDDINASPNGSLGTDSEYGLLATALIAGKDVVERNHDDFLRRTGQMPITAATVTHKASRRVVDEGAPGYLRQTSAAKTRIQSSKHPVRAFTAMPDAAVTETRPIVGSTVSTPAARKEDARMPMAQKKAELKILGNMNHKLQYLTNPRYSQPSKLGGSEAQPNHAAKLFVVEPPNVDIQHYVLGKEYKTVLRIRNISELLRTARIVPPSGSQFRISRVIYPQARDPNGSPSGAVAAGMSIDVHVTFISDSRVDVEDAIRIVTEAGNFEVELRAQAEYPRLDIPEQVELGACFIGDAIRLAVQCANVGVDGTFELEIPGMNQTNPNVVRAPPFTLYPSQLTLRKGDIAEITIEYVPRDPGCHEITVQIRNAERVQHVQLRAQSDAIQLRATTLNEQPVLPEDAPFFDLLQFTPVYLGSEVSQEFELANMSLCPVEFEWLLLPTTGTPQCSARGKETSAAIGNTALRNRHVLSGVGLDDVEVMEAIVNSKQAATKEYLNAAQAFENKPPQAARSPMFASARSPLFTPARHAQTHSQYLDNTPLPTPVPASQFVMRRQDSNGVLIPVSSMMDYLLNPSNVARCGGFTISPARGDIEPMKSHKFTATYIPEDVTVGQARAILVLKRVPLVAFHTDEHSRTQKRLNTPSQTELLRDLGTKGHGEFVRFRSWLDELQEEVSVTVFEGTTATDAIRLSIVHSMLDSIPNEHSHAGVSLAREWIEYASSNVPEVADGFTDDVDAIELDQRLWGVFRSEGDLWVARFRLEEHLGSEVCSLLDEQVPHEAVHALRELTLTDAPYLQLGLQGEGLAIPLSLFPPRLTTGKKLVVGESWKGSFTIVNPAYAHTEVEWAEPQIAEHGTQTFTYFVNDHADVEIQPTRTIVMAQSSTQCEVFITPWQIGKYVVKIPCHTFGALRGLTMVIDLEVETPTLRFHVPEIDFGLQAVRKSATRCLTFTNDGPSPLDFRFLETTFDTTDISVSEVQSTQDGGQATEITVSPLQGSIDAGATVTVEVACNAGRDAMKLRGNIECHIMDKTRGIVVNKSWVGYRADIQTPRVVLSPPALDLGTIYKGVPVVQNVTLTNLTDLDGQFKFVQLESVATACLVQFEPKYGLLGPKQSRTVQVTIQSTEVAVLDTLLACTIHGIKQPLPLAIRAISKGVQVDIQVLDDDDPVPSPLADPNTAQFIGSKELLTISDTPSIDFQALRLYGREFVRVLVRNLSAVPTSINASIRDFPVKVPSPDANIAPDTKLQTGVYQSKQGRAYMQSKLQKREDAAMLSTQSGVAFELTKTSLLLPSWGVAVIGITAFNEMPGFFTDELLLDIDQHRPVKIPIKLNVSGCPLYVDPDVTGMTRKYDGMQLTRQELAKLAPDAPQRSEKLRLSLGTMVANTPPQARVVRIHNLGPRDASLRWCFKQTQSRDKVRVVIKLQDEDARRELQSIATTRVMFPEEFEDVLPFAVEPDVLSIPARSAATCTMQLFAQQPPGLYTAIAIGAIEWPGRSHVTSRSPTGVSGSVVSPNADSMVMAVESSYTTGTHQQLVIAVQADVCQPRLLVNEQGVVPGSHVVQEMLVDPIELERGWKRGANVAASSRTISFANPTNATVSFTLQSTAPFVFASSRATPSGLTSGMTTSVGQAHTLQPQEAVILKLLYMPTREIKQKLSQHGTSGAANAFKESGELTVTFSNGDAAHIQTVAVFEKPMLIAAPTSFDFGTVRCAGAVSSTIFLGNPSHTCAKWRVQHVPTDSDADNQWHDDPSVFSFNATNGELQGPTRHPKAVGSYVAKDAIRTDDVFPSSHFDVSWKAGTLTVQDAMLAATRRASSEPSSSAQQCEPFPLQVTFEPRQNVHFRSRFRVQVKHGNTFDILLFGSGTFEEHLHKPTKQKIG